MLIRDEMMQCLLVSYIAIGAISAPSHKNREIEHKFVTKTSSDLHYKLKNLAHNGLTITSPNNKPIDKQENSGFRKNHLFPIIDCSDLVRSLLDRCLPAICR